MFNNQRIESLKSALQAGEDLNTISSFNIANSNTIGYKALKGTFAPDCKCQSFEDLLNLNHAHRSLNNDYPITGEVRLEIKKDNSPGKKIYMNGKEYEGSNVETTKEMSNLIAASSVTRAALAALQLDNRIQQEILNLGRQ
ncbi:MAG: hypothetical protein SFT81_02275 [Candidatus Caenarcaniphilales bacterium]|nr:hypothetical protein [Candidatus Caenarcaniphilales bacterium]